MNTNLARTLHILLVEENPTDMRLTVEALKEGKVVCNLHWVKDGVEALDFLYRRNEHAQAIRPDLILLDLNLPRHSGLEVLQALRANRAFAKMPVAIVSSSSLSRERKNLEPYGVGRFITKPSELDEFLRIGLSVKELLVETKLRETLFGKRKSLPTTL